MTQARKKTFFQNNMKLLKQKHPSTWEAISNAPESIIAGPKVIISENGKPNVLVRQADGQSIFIHEQRDPGSEAIAFLNSIAEDFHGTVLVFGMGMGYMVTSLLESKIDLQHLIIFELDIEIFKLALMSVNLEKVLTDDRVILTVGEVDDVDEILKPAKRSMMLEDIHTHKLLTCFQVNKKYEVLASDVFDHVSAWNIDGATQTYHGKTFIENRLRHLTAMHHDKKLEDLEGKFNGVPALMVAAGPSLDKNIDQIHRAVGKSVIFAVDTALPALLEQGIVPDFVTAIDYNDPIYEKIASAASQPVSRKIKLICTSWVACTVTKIFPAASIFWAFGSNAFEHWMNGLLGGRLTIGGAGTVAHLNYVAANAMGCDPLIFVGQDLAHSYDREHASNVVFTGTETMEKILKEAIWVKGVTTEKVPTTRNLHGYRVLFEQWIPLTDAKVINATEGGAWIEGAEHMSLAQAVETFCHSEFSIEPKVPDRQKKKFKAPMESMLRRVVRAEKNIRKIENIGRPILKEVTKLHLNAKKIFSLPMLPNKLQKKILDLDTCHNKADRDTLWEIFDELTMGGLKQNEREIREIERLEGLPEHYLEWLHKSIERMDRVNTIRKENLGSFKRQLTGLISFHDKEQKLQNQIDRGKETLDPLLDLLRLYYKSGDYTLLFNVMDQYGCDRYENPEIHFYYGIISLYRGEYENADRHFDQCRRIGSSFRQKILKKRREMADYYYDWGKTLPLKSLHNPEDKSGIYLRLKGLKMYPNHEGICTDFKVIAEKELSRISAAVEKEGAGILRENEASLKAWIDFFDEEQAMAMGFEAPMQLSYYRFYGKLILDGNRPEEALALYRRAIDRFSNRPELFISAADICFSINAFDQGIQYLKKAVELDKGYVVYWQNMGDNLVARGDFKGALLAYNEVVNVRPERREFWQKIGDCQKALGNEDAAREAYQRHLSVGG